MSAIMTILGFSACDEIGTDMYGCPHATFKVSGNVTDEAGAPVSGAYVIVKGVESRNFSNSWTIDTLSTNQAGVYKKDWQNFLPAEKIRFVCEDPGGEFASDSVTVEPHYTGGDKDWYVGEATERVDFKLKKVNKDLELPQIFEE